MSCMQRSSVHKQHLHGAVTIAKSAEVISPDLNIDPRKSVLWLWVSPLSNACLKQIPSVLSVHNTT